MLYQALYPGAVAAAPENLAEYSADELRSFTYTAATGDRMVAGSRRAGLLALYRDLCADLRAEAASQGSQATPQN